MASRPFSAIIVYLPDSGQRINAESGDQTDGNTGLDKSATGDFPPSSFMSTKAIESNGKTCNRIVQKADNPTPIALEPCHRNRAAVLSLILRLPTGGSGQVPIGQTGIAIASALVSLGPGAQKMSKSNGNNRKGTSHISSNDNNSPVFL